MQTVQMWSIIALIISMIIIMAIPMGVFGYDPYRRHR